MTSDRQFETVVMGVFRTLLDIAVHPIDCAWQADADLVTATVELSGTVDAALLVETDRSQARMIAARLLDVDSVQVVDDDVRDGFGELANVIGGNLKETLAPDATLSPPWVVMKDLRGDARFHFGSYVHRQAFSIQSGTLWVTWLASNNLRTVRDK
jgi:CheY-specific phosphatase CheX